MMERIIINASAAHTGGAKTIFETYIDYITSEKGNQHYIVISPHTFKNTPNFTFIQKSTIGISTFLFSTIFVFWYCVKFKAYKIISFNNVNVIFPINRITYFHQSKALNKNFKDIKIFLYDFIIKVFLKKTKFIVQSEYIKELFLKKYKLPSEQVISSWPGFKAEAANLDTEQKLFSVPTNVKYLGVFPVSYSAHHKNIPLLNEIIPILEKEEAKIITLFEDSDKIFPEKGVFVNIGVISRHQLFKVYNEVNFMIFTSTDETVGLPIFEFLQTGKPAFVFRAAYSEQFHKQFGRPKNFILFDSASDFEKIFKKSINIFYDKIDYSRGEWDKIKF